MAQRSDKVLHFAVLGSPGMGHLIPLVELAKWLITTHSHRVNVTIFVTTTVVSIAQSQFLQSLTVSDCLQTIQLPPADISGRLSTDAAPVARLCVIVKESIPAFRSVVTAMASRPTALIVDLFCTDAFDVADELGIPKYVYITSSARFLALSLYLPTLDQEIEGEYVDLQEPIHVPGCKPVPVDDIVDPMLDRTNEQYAWYLAHASRYALAQGILLNSTEDLEPETLKALREDPVLRQISKTPIYPVGPIVRSLDEFTGQEEKECLAWLDEQPTESVLYVSLGSGGTLSNEQLTEFSLGLELSQKRFVWVVRPPARKETAASFFTSGNVSCGPSKYLPEGFMTRTKGRGFLVNTWGPQMIGVRQSTCLTVGGTRLWRA